MSKTLKCILCPLLLLMLTVVTSCRDYPCSRASYSLSLISFPQTEADSLMITEYTRGSNFVGPLRTYYVTRQNASYQLTGDTLEILFSSPVGQGIMSSYDYHIVFPRTGHEFRLTAIIEDYRTIRKGIAGTKEHCINEIESYQLNNQPVTTVDDRYTFYIKR